MKFSKFFVAGYALFTSLGAMAIADNPAIDVPPTAAGMPTDDLALLGLAVAALAAGAAYIRRRK